MTTKKANQSNDFSSKFSPKSTYDAWKSMVDEQLGRIETIQDEAKRYEKQSLGQAISAIDELSRLMKDSIDYTCQLTGEWRKVTQEAGQKTREMMKGAFAAQ